MRKTLLPADYAGNGSAGFHGTFMFNLVDDPTESADLSKVQPAPLAAFHYERYGS